MLTLISSFISMLNARIEGQFSSDPGTTWQTKVKWVPYMLLVNFYLFVSLALLITTIQWNLIFVLLLLTLVSWKTVNEQESFHKFFVRIGLHFLLIGCLTIITILINTYEDAIIWNLWATSIKLSELAIVKRKKYFNTISGVCISFGLFSLALEFVPLKIRERFYKQVEKDKNDDIHKENEEIHPLESDQNNAVFDQNGLNV